MDSPTLVAQLRELGLWPQEEAVQREVLALQQRCPEARLLAREMIQRDLLTPYQANQLLTGRSRSLVVGGYRILERLGEGGMGQVFKARHPRLHRLVALKIIRPEHVANPTSVERFCREIFAASQLAHPNIVRAYDAGQAGETYYFAMQYIDGVDLARLVKKEGPLAVDRALDHVTQAASGLQHIHEHGLIHRDIKPSNLMVTRPPGPGTAAEAPATGPVGPWGQVKILDLGTARLTERREEEGELNPTLTKMGTIMGTADYMAPEQALSSRHADIRSDIYSLGCSLYFMLTGQPPFPGGSAIEKIMRHQLDPPQPVERLRAAVPRAVRALLGRMMAKKPEDRFQTPREVVEAALAIAEGLPPVEAIPLTPDGQPLSAAVDTKPELITDFAFENARPATRRPRPSRWTRPATRRPRPSRQTRPAWALYAWIGGGVAAGLLTLGLFLWLLLHR
jgi:serine/threonine-protein kinase